MLGEEDADVRRDDQNERTYFRSERIIASNGQWFFATREGDQGPFRSRIAAEQALVRFVNEKVELAGFQKSRVAPPVLKPAPKKQPVTLELVPLERETPTIEPATPRIAGGGSRNLVF